MNMNKYLFNFFILVLFFSGCTRSQNTYSNTIQPIIKQYPATPLWLNDPQKESNGKLTAVGCASKHINGEVAQKKLALQRAIDEIAMQKKTKVQTVSYSTKSSSNGTKTSATQSSSLHEIEKV